MITVNKLIDSAYSFENKIRVYNDVTYNNLETVKKAYKECKLYLDRKFDIPVDSNISFSNNSKSISSINNFLNSIIADVNSGKQEIIKNDTQYKNFRTKIIYWCNTLFKDILKEIDNDNDVTVLIHSEKVSKHEWLFIQWLCKLGVNFVIICKNTTELSINDKDLSLVVTVEEYNTNDNLEYKDTEIVIKESKVYTNLSEVETALYENKETIQLIINGMDNYIDTKNFYGRLYKECRDNPEFKLYDKGFDKPTYEQSMSIPRLKINKADYIIETVIKFLNIKDKDVYNSIEKAIRYRFSLSDLKGLDSQKLFNKIVYCVLTLNNIFNNNVYRYIIYYGTVNNNDKIVLEVLSNTTDISFLVVNSDKTKAVSINNVNTLNLDMSCEVFDIPTVDTRNNAHTVASEVIRIVDEQLFSGNTLGMYKPGQFRKLEVKMFNTTFDEIELWWNKEMHIRPGFEALGDKAVIPTLFKVIKGVKTDRKNYVEYIQQLSCGKTLLCKDLYELRDLSSFKGQMYNHNFEGMYIHGLTDINKTRFDVQKPFYENGKLNRKRIQSSVNYRYSFLSGDKQEIILDRIEKILNSKYINTAMYNEITDEILSVLLNLDKKVLQYIQWFEFYTYNPNLVLVLDDEKTLNVKEIALLMFLYFMGFDVIIFVPTCYTSIENLVTERFMFDTHIVGEADYDIDINNVYVTDNIEIEKQNNKKQSFFDKLFNR